MSDVVMVSDSRAKTLRFLAAADQVLSKASKMLANVDRPDCTGGYLAWTDSNGVPFIAGLMWGSMPADKAVKRQETALEKATRLALHNLHRTSYRSRNPKAVVIIDGVEVLRPRWGGAIRAGADILSFSGFPEKWDEAAMFVLAIKLGWISRDDVFRHISPKRNPHLRPLLEACHWTE